ncbi:unnamed protein product [Natator depressus]
MLLLLSRLQPLGTSKAQSKAFPIQCTSPEKGEGARGRELPGDRRSQVLLLPLSHGRGVSAPQPAAAPPPPPQGCCGCQPRQSQLLTGGLACRRRSHRAAQPGEGADALGSRACCLLQIQKSRWDFRDKRWFSQVLEVIEYLVTDSSPEGQLYA